MSALDWLNAPGLVCFFSVLCGEETHASDVDGVSLRRRSEFVCYQNADAVPVGAAAMKRAATAASTVQEAQFYARPTRHGVIKCYREFVVGRPVCRHFHRWWW